MSSPAKDIADYLAAQGVGTLGASSGWSINVAKEPAKPDSTVTVYDTPGNGENVIAGIARVSIQIRARAHAYLDAYEKLEAAKNELIQVTAIEVNGQRYFGQWIVGGIQSLGYDDNDRAILVANFNLNREV